MIRIDWGEIDTPLW